MNPSKKNRFILILLFLGVLMGALDLSVVGPSLPAIEKSLLFPERYLSWIFSIYLLFYLFGIPLMSKLSDIHGRKMLYVVSVAVFAAGSGVVSLSQDINSLLMGRAIQGFGSSGIFPVAAATIGDIFPVEKRGRALGLLGAVFGIAFILGPLLAGTMLHFFNWNSIFLINLPLAVLLIVFALRLLPGKPEVPYTGIKWKGIIMLILILSSFTLGINSINVSHLPESLSSWSVMPFLLIVLIMTPVFLAHERTQKDSFLSIDFFGSKQLRLAGLIAFGLGMFQSSIVFIPKLAVMLFSVNPSRASFMLMPLVIFTAIVPPVSGYLLDKIGSRIIIVTGLSIAVVSLLLFSTLSKSIPFFYAAEACLGIGLAIRSSLKYIVLNEINAKERAASLGMLIILITLGQLTGASLIGIIISGSTPGVTGFGKAFLFLTFIILTTTISSLFLKSRLKEKTGC